MRHYRDGGKGLKIKEAFFWAVNLEFLFVFYEGEKWCDLFHCCQSTRFEIQTRNRVFFLISKWRSANSNSPLSRASLFFAAALVIAVAERRRMETLKEDEEYNWREVNLPSLIPKVAEPELERETGERRRGRDVLVAIDHGPNSKHAFDWALVHFCRLADTVHLIHAVSDVNNEVVYQTTQALMEKLAVEALQVSMVTRTVARIVEGEPGKVICREADRLRPAALIMGTRGRGLIQSVLQGSVGEYCFHNCKAAPIIIVPGKESGERSVI